MSPLLQGFTVPWFNFRCWPFYYPDGFFCPTRANNFFDPNWLNQYIVININILVFLGSKTAKKPRTERVNFIKKLIQYWLNMLRLNLRE